MQEIKDAASMQCDKIEKEIKKLNQKLREIRNLQDKLSEAQKQLILVKQDEFKIHNKLYNELKIKSSGYNINQL